MRFSMLGAVIAISVLLIIGFVSILKSWALTIALVSSIVVTCIGVYMFIQGTKGKIHRKSPVTISGSINRREFYGALATLFGIMQISIANITGRIDLLYQLISQLPK